MNKTSKIVLGVVIVVVLGLLWMFSGSDRYGATTRFSGITVGSDGLVVNGASTLAGAFSNTSATTLASTTATSLKTGQLGTQATLEKWGTCNLIGTPTITATSSAPMDCAITGIVAGDNLTLHMATTSRISAASYWSIVGYSASSTSGYATVNIYNGTGADGVPPIGATSSLQYRFIH